MVTLAFDGRMGASGDMLLAALLAAGADSAALDPVERRLDVRYDVSETSRCGITATTVDVVVDDGDGGSREHTDDHGDGYNHGHDHDHTDDNGPAHAEGSGPHRSYTEVVGIVESMDLPAAVEATALAIFERLGEAEAAVHGTDLASTQFHEVGADDAIADVVGVSLLLEDLNPDRVVTTPLSTGGGEVSTSHGVYPVPVPAVVELAEGTDWSLRGGPVESELLTPTGAAILAHVADGLASLPTLDLDASGYGAGRKAFDSHPNVLRALVGGAAGGLREDPVTVLETNLDDATPETLGGLQEALAPAGALDVTVLPTTMKKSRPGHLVKVIARPEDATRVARRLAAETGTLGVREHGSGHRFVADRTVETVTVDVDGQSFDVDVKVARFAGGSDDPNNRGEVFDVSAEYDDALAVATATDLAVREVRRLAESRARASLDLISQDQGGE
jgi:uncharacterized protein (TIGR00299 family) protein